MTLSELIPVLQTAIGPVVLISGVGLLILSLTNRLGRIIDRGRSLAGELLEAHESKHPGIKQQLVILSRRARLIKSSIIFSVICALLAAVLVITLFIFATMDIEAAWFLSILFGGAMASLIISLVCFLQELNLALIAFNLDIKV